ncbi:MAG: Maf family protein [Terriglobia bacterium]
MTPLILASRSPRRAELLKNAGVDFTIRAADLDETRLAGESAEEYVCRLAREKALRVSRFAPPGSLVLGADTAVAIAGRVFGKPANAADAIQMLRLLSGATHRVLTGFCIVQTSEKVEALRHESTAVTFRPLTQEEIERYVASGEPLDKAGAYAIQGAASSFVTRVNGSIPNVVGLPVGSVIEALKKVPGFEQDWRELAPRYGI